MKTIHLDPAAVPAKLAAGYKGRKFKAVVTDQPVTLSNTYWSGGTRSTYSLINLDTGHRTKAAGPELNPPQFGGAPEPMQAEIPPNHAIVEHSMFCGKDMGLTIYIRPDNAADLLPAPVELTDAERCVLEFTRSRKSSYAGQNRFQMHQSESHWRDYDPFSLEDWTAAQDSLKDRKLLNKAGAITPAGRNAIGDSRQFCQ